MNQISRLVVGCARGGLALGLLCTTFACGGRVNPDLGPSDDTGAFPGLDSGLDDGRVPPGPIDGSPLPGDATPFPDDASFTDSTPGLDAGPLPSSTVCDELAKAICDGPTKTCCSTHSVTYDAAGCEGAEKSYCETERTWVKSGRLTFDPTQLDACKAGWTKALTACSVDWIEWFKDDQACAHLFNGTIAVGDKCTYDVECNSPPGGRGYCDPSSKRCRVYDFVGPGKGCNFSGKTIHYCESGYFCDTTSTTPTCLPQHPLGATCDGPDDFSCGYNNVCKDGACAPGLPVGSTCDASSIECASWSCTGSKCTSTNIELADPSICSGSGLAGGGP